MRRAVGSHLIPDQASAGLLFERKSAAAAKFAEDGHRLSISRAITMRWTSLVPSPMVQSFTSR